MQSSQPSRLEADQQLSVNPSSGDPVPEQSSELQAGVSSNVAAFQVSIFNPSRSVLSCRPLQSVLATAVHWLLTYSSHSRSPVSLQKR